MFRFQIIKLKNKIKVIALYLRNKSTILMNFNSSSFLNKSIFFMLLSLFFSCASKKEIVYYQNIDGINTSQNIASYEVKIQPDDLLMIIVSAEDPEIAMPFNLTTVTIPNASNLQSAMGQQTIQSYLVDRNGNIEFPVLFIVIIS